MTNREVLEQFMAALRCRIADATQMDGSELVRLIKAARALDRMLAA